MMTIEEFNEVLKKCSIDMLYFTTASIKSIKCFMLKNLPLNLKMILYCGDFQRFC